ncbi:MAG: oligosaccharide flippase family protein, partial [Colwellia sp.]
FALGPIGAAALGLITLPIITWFYSAEDVGRISMLQVAVSFCVLIFSLGLDQAYVREYHESKYKPALFKATLLPGLILLVLGLCICLIRPSFISKTLFSVESDSISIIVALCLLAAFISRFLSLILRMQGKGLAFSMGQILPKILFLVVIGIYFFLSISFEFYYLVLAHTLSIVFVSIVYAWNTRKEWLESIRQNINLSNLNSMLRFGAPLIIGGMAFWGLTTMDRLFLRSLSTFEELAIYSVASSFAAAGMILQSIFSTVWAPIVYKWAAEGIDTKKIDQVTEHLLAAVVFIFILAGLFSWVVTYILPGNYGKVQFILAACLASPLLYTLSETTVVGLGITKKSGYAMLASLIAAAANFIGNYYLVPLYGAAGAAVSTAFSFFIFLVFRTELSCLVWRNAPRVKLYISILICISLAVCNAFIGSELGVFMPILWLGAGVGALWIFYASIISLKDVIPLMRH